MPGLVFLAGLGSGVTEAVVVVTPAEVCKIRMQAQFHSLLDPQEMARRKYRNVLQTAAVVAREEGVGALYKGLAPTVLRQGGNQVRVCGAALPSSVVPLEVPGFPTVIFAIFCTRLLGTRLV